MSYITRNQNARIAYEQRNFSIDSKKRFSSSSSITSFDHSFELPSNHDFDKVSCLLAEIPKSYYMLDTTATFTLNETTGAVDTTVSITGGRNYTGTQLATALGTALTTASATGANAFTYTCSLSLDTGKFSITASSGDFTLTFNSTTDANRDIAKYLGFTSSSITASSATSILTSLNVIDLQRYDVLYIRSNIANNAGDDLLAEIYVGSYIDYSMINYTTPDANLHSVGLADNVPSVANFTLVDDSRKTVNLNGVNWRFIVQAYKTPKIFLPQQI